MFDDIIKKEKQDSKGCYCCKHASPVMIALYCSIHKIYTSITNGRDCKEFEEKE